MNLAIDIGNSFTHFAVFNGRKLLYTSKCAADDKSEINKSLITIKKKFEIGLIGVASVNVAAGRIVNALCKKQFKLLPVNINYKNNLPIKINVKNPVTLGSDRICNSVFGYDYFKGKQNVLVADLGTANTYDVVTTNGEFIGGIIAPGIMTSSKALNINTSKLPLLEYSKLKLKAPLVGKNTFEAIQSGLVNYMKFATEGIVDSLRKHFKGNLKVIITGGSSEFLLSNVNFKYIYIENTVLNGINIILNYQKSVK